QATARKLQRVGVETNIGEGTGLLRFSLVILDRIDSRQRFKVSVLWLSSGEPCFGLKVQTPTLGDSGGWGCIGLPGGGFLSRRMRSRPFRTKPKFTNSTFIIASSGAVAMEKLLHQSALHVPRLCVTPDTMFFVRSRSNAAKSISQGRESLATLASAAFAGSVRLANLKSLGPKNCAPTPWPYCVRLNAIRSAAPATALARSSWPPGPWSMLSRPPRLTRLSRPTS